MPIISLSLRSSIKYVIFVKKKVKDTSSWTYVYGDASLAVLITFLLINLAYNPLKMLFYTLIFPCDHQP